MSLKMRNMVQKEKTYHFKEQEHRERKHLNIDGQLFSKQVSINEKKKIVLYKIKAKIYKNNYVSLMSIL